MAQTNAITVVTVYHGGGDAPASIGSALELEEGNPRQEAEALSRFFAAAAGGVRPCKLRVRTDSCGATRASITLGVTQANIAAGEFITVIIPGVGGFKLVCVSSAADAEAGEFVSETSDSATATNIAAAVNAMIGLKDRVIATTNSGSVILTARIYGSAGNGYAVLDGTTNGISGEGAFAGGKDASTRLTATIGCVAANTDADDTLKLGAVTFTAKASGATGDDQFNIGASNTAMADNLVAKINAHPKLAGIVSGVAASGTITLTYHVDPRVAEHIQMVSSDADGIVVTQPSTTLTLAGQVATRTYALGAP